MARLWIGLTVLLAWGCTSQTDNATRTVVPVAQSSAAGWNEFQPGGDTLCSDGTPYKFFARQGDPKKLMIYLEGGGACWFRQNCDPQINPTYTINLEGRGPRPHGVFDFDREDNPLRDYTVVYAPYCSADVHLGATDTVYPPLNDTQQPLTIHHRGFANAQSAIDWAYANVRAPETVFVTGSSAGSIPSPYYAMKAAQHYPGARVVQLGDGSGGYRRTEGVTLPHKSWKTLDRLKDAPTFADAADDTFNYNELYTRAAKATPNVQFAAYDAAEDLVQRNFLTLTGARDVSLQEMIELNQADIRAKVPGFKSYIAGGDSHTILSRPEFYSYRVGEVAFQTWLTDLVNGKSVDDLSCEKCGYVQLVGADIPEGFEDTWIEWESDKQRVEAFRIFDNLSYVGIDWVSAYVLETSEGLVLIDALYGKWIPHLESGLRKLGLDPNDIRYVIPTHGHFDHAGGAAYFQDRYGARVVMSEPDWEIALAPSDNPYFAMTPPQKDLVATDGQRITLGDTTITLLRTPGHTPGVVSLMYPVRDGDATHTAITLGGIGLNFSGVEQTESYIASYERLIAEAGDVSVSLTNHASMADVFGRAKRLATRQPGEPHPFVDPEGYRTSLDTFLARAKEKLVGEKNGTAKSALEALKDAID